MVGSQIVSLTPGPSFAHNLGCRCPNDQCEAIFDIYASRPFSATPRTRQCNVFWALLSNSKHLVVPEDSKSPTLGVLGFTPTLGQNGVATFKLPSRHASQLPQCAFRRGHGGGEHIPFQVPQHFGSEWHAFTQVIAQDWHTSDSAT